MTMLTQRECFVLLAVLCFIELLAAAALRWTTAKLQKSLAGRVQESPIESLSPSERDAVISEATQAFTKTIGAKIDILVMAYHFPAALCSALIQRTPKRPRGSPLAFSFGFTILFWFVVISAVISVVRFVRNSL
jgi:hypothetical protein